MTAVMGNMKHEAIFHCRARSGKVQLHQDASGALRLQFEGAKLLAAMEPDQQRRVGGQNLDSFGGKEKPRWMRKSTLVFGSKAPVRAVVSNSRCSITLSKWRRQKKESEKIRKQLGMGSATVTIAAAGTGQGVERREGRRVRLVSDVSAGKKNSDFRPFNDEPGYTLALRVDFPGNILAVTDENQFTKRHRRRRQRSVAIVSGSERSTGPNCPNKGRGIDREQLKLPAPGVKGLKGYPGAPRYQVASATKEVDLQVYRWWLTRGTELRAQIKSIKDGWQNDGSPAGEGWNSS